MNVWQCASFGDAAVLHNLKVYLPFLQPLYLKAGEAV
jgi:hypothetical protein